MDEDVRGGFGGPLDFLEYFSALRDPRQSIKVLYPLDEVLFLTLCAVLCGADGWVSVDLRRAGRGRVPDLSHHMDAASERAIAGWSLSTARSRAARSTGPGKGAIHMVSAWGSQQKMVLGAQAVNEKSNEITAIPELIELRAIKGAIVTIDAMGYQKKLAEKILDKKADFVSGLKGNQATLRDDVELLFNEQYAIDFRWITVSRAPSTDAGHGRIETRQVFATDNIAWLKERATIERVCARLSWSGRFHP